MELQAKIDAVQSRINEIRRRRLAAMNAKRLELLENEERALLRKGGQVTTASGSGAGTTLVPANAQPAAMAAGFSSLPVTLPTTAAMPGLTGPAPVDNVAAAPVPPQPTSSPRSGGGRPQTQNASSANK